MDNVRQKIRTSLVSLKLSYKRPHKLVTAANSAAALPDILHVHAWDSMSILFHTGALTLDNTCLLDYTCLPHQNAVTTPHQQTGLKCIWLPLSLLVIIAGAACLCLLCAFSQGARCAHLCCSLLSCS